MATPDNPWLTIPADDYEAHMSAVGQSSILRELFAAVYAEVRPARLAILGCTTGDDFATIDPAVTSMAVGVDVNPEYIAIADSRAKSRGQQVHLVMGDVLKAELPPAPYDLVHAALLIEYLEPRALLERVHDWLAGDGTFSLITQEPAEGLPNVSRTKYESLSVLAATMKVWSAHDLETLADGAGFLVTSRRRVSLSTGKSLLGTTFKQRRRVA